MLTAVNKAEYTNRGNTMLLRSTQNFLLELFKIGAVKVDTEKGFRLALHDKNPSAPLSPLYVNLRTPENKNGPLQREHVETIAHQLIDVAAHNHINYDGVTGVPRAGTPFAKAISQVSSAKEIPYVGMSKRSDCIRSMRIDRRNISEQARNATRLLIGDDLVTQSDTKLAAIEAVRKAGYEVAGIVVYLDREQGGFESLLRSGIPIASVVKLSEMLAFYESQELISTSELKKIRSYLSR